MLIRRMTEQDCIPVAQIEADSFSDPWSLSAFTETVRMQNYVYLVAEEEGEILGYCCFISVLDEGEIPNVCVKASARGSGVGRRLMERLIEEAKERNLTVLYLEVRKSNAPARHLYESLGFEEDGIRKGFYEFPKEDAVLMHRML